MWSSAGAIPFGVVVSKAMGLSDPRTVGSKNVGFTNVLRVSGKTAGILTLLGDMGKGWVGAKLGCDAGANCGILRYVRVLRNAPLGRMKRPGYLSHLPGAGVQLGCRTRSLPLTPPFGNACHVLQMCGGGHLVIVPILLAHCDFAAAPTVSR